MPRKKKIENIPNEAIIGETVINETQGQPTDVAPTPPNKANVLFFIENKSIRPQEVALVKEEIKKASSNELLYVVLNTVGGDVYTTVRIVKLLQNNFKKVVVIVPEYAYSSGTVMCLGCDEIHMSIEATLGPLDLPMEHPSDGSAMSSQDVTQTITNLASMCTSIGMSTFNELRSNNNPDLRLSKKYASELAFETASKLISPIIEKIDPFNLQKGFRESKIGFYYAIDLLSSKSMANNISQAIRTSSSLVNDYPSHGYGIFRDEAKHTLKLNVYHLEDLAIWSQIEPMYNKVTQISTTNISFQLI